MHCNFVASLCTCASHFRNFASRDRKFLVFLPRCHISFPAHHKHSTRHAQQSHIRVCFPALTRTRPPIFSLGKSPPLPVLVVHDTLLMRRLSEPAFNRNYISGPAQTSCRLLFRPHISKFSGDDCCFVLNTARQHAPGADTRRNRHTRSVYTPRIHRLSSVCCLKGRKSTPLCIERNKTNATPSFRRSM